jgi:hypothetical protein
MVEDIYLVQFAELSKLSFEAALFLPFVFGFYFASKQEAATF